MIRRILLGLVVALALVVIAGVGWLVVAPPELLRVADGYAAKSVCSSVFVAGRDAADALNDDVQAPGNPILRLVTVNVDQRANTVTARLLGFIASQMAIARPGLGCASVPDGRVAEAQAIRLDPIPPITPAEQGIWPHGETVDPADPKFRAIIDDPKLAGPGMRAVVVVKDGRIVADGYGPGFADNTSLLGWSMTKTVNAILIGRAMLEGKLTLADAGLFADWADGRKDIKLSDLASMTSGLAFNEDYGDVSDVTRMLYLEPDMAKFALTQRPEAPPGTRFNYSSGTGVMLARIWMDKLGGGQAALAYPRMALFNPLGMTTATMEADEAGTFVGSSYLYASGRDWARIGQLLVDDGVWNGERMLPEGFVALMGKTNGLPGGYSKLQTWLDPDPGLPADTFWLEGHDGQSIAVIPSARLVVLRMGLTPSDLGYSPVPLVKAVLAATAR